MTYNKDFLKKLDADRNRVVFARITKLQFNETPIETIEGRVTQGSITLAGNSSVRRTCSLTMVTTKVDISDYVWSLHTKFKLEVGLENHVDNRYPDIIWFDQGIYLISSFSSALSTNGLTITLQGKDKMCQLNGEIGGTFTSSIDFGKMEQVKENGEVEYIPQLLRDIIREMVHAYGGEPFHNIIINDLESKALMLQEYRRNTPMYLLRQANDYSGTYERAYFNDIQIYVPPLSGTMGQTLKLSEVPVYDSLASNFEPGHKSPTIIKLNSGDSKTYCVAKIEYGQTAGFLETDLTYTGDLIANAGETVTSVLDKIKNMLGNFEYFYNTQGQFVFQQQKNYLNSTYTPIETSEDQVWVNSEKESYIYSLLDSELVTAFNNTPNITNLKNDYSVWGTRSTSGGSIPVHMRYALQTKPISYTTIEVFDKDLVNYNKRYGLGVVGQKSKTYVAEVGTKTSYDNGVLTLDLDAEYSDTYKTLTLFTKHNYSNNTLTLSLSAYEDQIFCDWREIIYQMALDYRKYNHLDDFQLRVAKANPELYPTGITGYEQYYVDMEGFWRQLYNQEIQYDENYNIDETKTYYKQNVEFERITPPKNPQGEVLYYNSASPGCKNDYKKVFYLTNGEEGYYTPIGEDNKKEELYIKNSSYKKMTNSELDQLKLFPANEERDLYIVTYCGLRKDIQNEEGQYFYFTKVHADNNNSYQYYTKEIIDIIDNNTQIMRLTNIPVRNFDGNTYWAITEISDLSLVSETQEIYTKKPYPIYRQVPLKGNENLTKETYYNIKKPTRILEDETYYAFQNTYMPAELVTKDLSNRKEYEGLLQAYKINETILQYFTEKGTQGLFNLCAEDLEFLILCIKKLLYSQLVLKTEVFEKEQTHEKRESAEKFESAEEPAQKDYVEFLNLYYPILQELNKRFDSILNDFSKYSYDAFMTEKEFKELYQNFNIFLSQTLDNIQLICQLYVNKEIKYKDNVDFYEFLFGPIIEFAQLDSYFGYEYPDLAQLNSALHKVNQLENMALIELKETISKTQQIKMTLQNFKAYLDTHSFSPTKYYSEVIEPVESEMNKYFYIEPAMCYTISTDFYLSPGINQYWNRNVYECPDKINFWIEFLDCQGELSKFNVDAIGARQKVVNDNSVKSIYYRNAPLVIYSTQKEDFKETKTGYSYLCYDEGEKKNIFGLESIKTYTITKSSLGNPYCSDTDVELGSFGESKIAIKDQYNKKEYYYWRYENVQKGTNLIKTWRGVDYNDVYSQIFGISAQGKSAKDAIDNLLYQHSYCAENASITTVPIYHLEPNNRIYVYDKDTGIEGEYLATQMTIPLTYSGTMSITATKAIDRII